jgi:hypothetical protein
MKKRVLEVEEAMVGASVVMIIGYLIIIALIHITTTDDANNTYYRSAIVTDVKGKEVYLEDTTHNVWCVEDDSLQMYGRYILTMDSMGTETIFDDEIIEVK